MSKLIYTELNQTPRMVLSCTHFGPDLLKIYDFKNSYNTKNTAKNICADLPTVLLEYCGKKTHTFVSSSLLNSKFGVFLSKRC